MDLSLTTAAPLFAATTAAASSDATSSNDVPGATAKSFSRNSTWVLVETAQAAAKAAPIVRTSRFTCLGICGPILFWTSDGSSTSKPCFKPRATSEGAGSFSIKMRSSTKLKRPESRHDSIEFRSVAGVLYDKATSATVASCTEVYDVPQYEFV